MLEKGYTKIELIFGASLGVAVAYRPFLDPDFNVSHAWFDGVAFIKKAPFIEWFMKKLFRQKKRALVRTPVEASGTLVKMYGFDFAKMMTQNFSRITEGDIEAIILTLERRTLIFDIRRKPFTNTCQRQRL